MRLILPFLSLLLLFYSCSNYEGDKTPASQKPKEKSVEEMLIGDWEQMGLDTMNLDLSPMFYEEGVIFANFSDQIFTWWIQDDTLEFKSLDSTYGYKFLMTEISDSALSLTILSDDLQNLFFQRLRNPNEPDFKINFKKKFSSSLKNFKNLGFCDEVMGCFNIHEYSFYLVDDTLYYNNVLSADKTRYVILSESEKNRIYQQYNYCKSPLFASQINLVPGSMFYGFSFFVELNDTSYVRDYIGYYGNEFYESYLAHGILYYFSKKEEMIEIPYRKFHWQDKVGLPFYEEEPEPEEVF
jgi:hypothetical protein